MKNIVLETYNWQNIVDAIPFSMRDSVSVSFDWYGFVHDTGFKTIIRKPCDGHPVISLEEAKRQFEANVTEAKEMWRIAEEYAYH